MSTGPKRPLARWGASRHTSSQVNLPRWGRKTIEKYDLKKKASDEEKNDQPSALIEDDGQSAAVVRSTASMQITPTLDGESLRPMTSLASPVESVGLGSVWNGRFPDKAGIKKSFDNVGKTF